MSGFNTYQEGADAIRKQFYDKWKAIDFGIGYTPEIYWQNSEPDSAPDPTKINIFFRMFPYMHDQSTLNNCISVGTKRHTCYGIIVIEFNCPKSISNSGHIGEGIASVARSIFIRPGNEALWFKNTRVKSLPQRSEFYVFELLTEFQFDTFE